MKCSDVQTELWSGSTTTEMEAHLQTCPSCQQELADFGQILSKLNALETPKSTRSLKPSRDVIRQTVRKNRQHGIRRFTAIAASVAVLLGTVTGLALHGNLPLTTQMAQKQLTQKPAEVHVAQDATNPDVCNAIATYIRQTLTASQVKEVTITGFKPVTETNLSTSRVQGDVFFTLALQSKDITNLQQVPNQSHVVLVRQNGKWEVSVMEQLVAPKTPQEAVNQWINALKTRNGTLEFGLLTPELKRAYRPEYVARYWSIGGSSPWIDTQNTQISGGPIDDRTWQFYVSAPFTTSGGPIGQDQIYLRVAKCGDAWYITNRVYDQMSFDSPESKLTMPDKTVLSSIFKNTARWGNTTVKLLAIGGESGDNPLSFILRNDGKKLDEKSVQGPMGPAFLYKIARGSKQPDEYWLVTVRNGGLHLGMQTDYAILISSDTNDDQDMLGKLQQLQKSWQVPQIP